uniref:sporozoite surface protein 2-like n=1 Tax=Agelaius phoeniceus TaxID=39638 RepID=UPI0023EAC5EF|nr:sporozoite surface protein 2-like [Agelaius phoeniceus]
MSRGTDGGIHTSKEEPSTPSCSKEPSTPSCSKEPSTPSFPKEPSTPSCTKEPSTPSCTKEPSTPSFPKEPSTSSFPKEPSTPSCSKEPSTPSCTKEPSTPSFPKEPSTSSPRSHPHLLQGSEEGLVTPSHNKASPERLSSSSSLLCHQSLAQALRHPVLRQDRTFRGKCQKEAIFATLLCKEHPWEWDTGMRDSFQAGGTHGSFSSAIPKPWSRSKPRLGCASRDAPSVPNPAQLTSRAALFFLSLP